MDKMLLTMRFEGSFNASQANGTQHQCGHQGQPLYKFKVEVVCPNRHVNENTGFLFDNAEIPQYFNERYTLSDICPSCERIAEVAVQYFVDMLHAEKIRPTNVKVTIMPNDYASLEAVWDSKVNRKRRRDKNKVAPNNTREIEETLYKRYLRLNPEVNQY